MNAPKFTFNEQDTTQGVGQLAKGISGFMGVFSKGPFAKPDTVIYNWTQFKELYGDFTSESTDPILVYRALDRGANLRINRVGHYSDLLDKSSLTAQKAEQTRQVALLIDRNTASGSVFSATVNGNLVTAEYNDFGSHEDYMQGIADVLSQASNGVKAYPFSIGGNLWGIIVGDTFGFNTTITGAQFTGNINGAGTAASAQVVISTLAPAAGVIYYLVNATTGQEIATYEANDGDTFSVVAAALRSAATGAYVGSGSGANVIITGTELSTLLNNNVLRVTALKPGIEEVRAYVDHTIVVGGTVGEEITIEEDGGPTLGTFTIQASYPTLNGLAAAINTGGSGYNAVRIGNTLRVYAPVGTGDTGNGKKILFTTSGIFEVQDPDALTANGVTAVPEESFEDSDVFSGGLNGGTGNPTISSSSSDNFCDALGQQLFGFEPLYEGIDGNQVQVYVESASNGSPAYFNLRIVHKNGDYATEIYQNLVIPGLVTVSQSTYLSQVQENSKMLKPVYLDLTGLTLIDGGIRPLNSTTSFQGGSNGGSITENDYIGSAEGEMGFYAFNPYNDMMQFCAGSIHSMTIHEAGAEYSDRYKSMVYMGHINHNLTEVQMAALMSASNIDTSWAMFFTGGLKVKHPKTGAPIEISEMGDVLGCFAKSDEEYGEWASVFNTKRGIILKTQGVVKNFGGDANYEKLNLLVTNRINPVITENGKTYIMGNTTAQIASSVTQFGNIRRLGLFMKKSLSPVMKSYLSEPNIPDTWYKLYVEVKPFLDGLLTKKALYTYTWKGDQFAKANLSNLEVNSAADVQLGKYKAKVSASAVPGMNEFEFTLSFDFVNGTFDIETA